MPSRIRPLQRELDRFRRNPASVRNATLVIISVTVAAVIVGSLVMWIFDKRDFPDFGTAFWFTLQTVTTVGYGDVTPESTLGRVIGGIVMVVAIAFVAIITASITSTFVEAAQRRGREDQAKAELDAAERLETTLRDVIDRLVALESTLARLESTTASAGTAAGPSAQGAGAPVDQPAPDAPDPDPSGPTAPEI